MSNTVEIIFAQFGDRCSIIDPSFSSFRKYFPEATFRLYCDRRVSIPGVSVTLVDPVFKKDHYRYGNRCNDYYKVWGLLHSNADFAICVDNDMEIVSPLVNRIVTLTESFGVCLPSNPRLLVRKDTLIGEDSDKILDETEGTAFALNMSPISFDTKNKIAKTLLSEYCAEILNQPVRGPLAMWRAIWKTKFYPCILPPQWCVCLEHCGIGDEIILHVGHQKVKEFYKR
jgi:hypothetical protein